MPPIVCWERLCWYNIQVCWYSIQVCWSRNFQSKYTNNKIVNGPPLLSDTFALEFQFLHSIIHTADVYCVPSFDESLALLSEHFYKLVYLKCFVHHEVQYKGLNLWASLTH